MHPWQTFRFLPLLKGDFLNFEDIILVISDRVCARDFDAHVEFDRR